MNILPHDKQIAIIAALTEGVSIRAIERLTSVHRDTVMCLGVRIGEGCFELHDRMMTGLALGITDHVWSVAELVHAATVEAPITDRPRFCRLQAIQGRRA